MRRLSLYAQVIIYTLAGINHFWHPQFYTEVLPSYVPYGHEVVYISGAVEIGLAMLLIPTRTRNAAAWVIIAMLAVYLLVHVQMVIDFIQQPDKPLWIAIVRVPLQFVLMLWAGTLTRRPVLQAEA